MSEAAHFHVIAGFIADGLAGLFAIAALLHLLPPAQLRLSYLLSGYARSFMAAAGSVMALAALFLAVPPLRIWGGALGGMVLFVAVTAFLNRERYLCAVPMMLLLAMLAPAMA